jgi:hypothetical protein
MSLVRFTNSSFSLIGKRFNGGGRPGGRPTFNWKEKKILGLDNTKLPPLKMRPSGLLEDIMPYFDESRGDFIIDITKLEKFEEPPEKVLTSDATDQRKVIHVPRLFGSHKPAKALPHLGRKTVFSGHRAEKRVFPRKKKDSAVSQATN